MESPQRICGGVRRVVVTEEQRYGPRWLCDNDDDDDIREQRGITECKEFT